MPILTAKFGLALVLLAASLFAVAPALTHANQQNIGTTSITATGQASPMEKGKGINSPAALDLTGQVFKEGDEGFAIRDLTGTLQIGSTTYSVTDGHGEVNHEGQVEINAKANAGGHEFELILHGEMQGNSIVFDAHDSKLAPMFHLSLTGQTALNLTTNSTSTTTSQTENESETDSESEGGD